MTQADDRADDLVPDDLLRAVEATLFAATEPITAEAISSQTLYSERNRLLLHAVNCARSWLNARRFPDPIDKFNRKQRNEK